MSLEIVHRYKLSCPRHPRYNPEREGDGGIKGGCGICSDLFRLWRGSQALLQECHDLAEKIVNLRRAGTGKLSARLNRRPEN